MVNYSWEKLIEPRRFEISGQVLECHGTIIRACLPGAAIGDRVRIGSTKTSKLGIVTGYNQALTSIVCIDGNDGVRTGVKVHLLPGELSIEIPSEPLGLALSPSGEILKGSYSGESTRIELTNKKVELNFRSAKIERFKSGIAVIDSLLPIALGQRMLICAEPGVGKTQLLTTLAEQSECDVIIFALIGERGREANEFISEKLSPAVRRKSVVVVSTSDDPALKRVLSAQLATCLADKYASQGKNVLLLFDSLTRYLRASRDVALASGEIPIRRGYPASTFAQLPKLLERTGNFKTGSITAFYTMLINSEVDEDPMLEEVKGILDGHLTLRRKIAERSVYPAISISSSLSRLASCLQNEEEMRDALQLKRLFGRLESDRELALFAERLDPELELAIKHESVLEDLVRGKLTASQVSEIVGLKQ